LLPQNLLVLKWENACSSAPVAVKKGHAGSKTLHQQNPPFLNWRCRLTQVDLYTGNGPKTVVVVVVLKWECPQTLVDLHSDHKMVVAALFCRQLLLSEWLIVLRFLVVNLLHTMLLVSVVRQVAFNIVGR